MTPPRGAGAVGPTRAVYGLSVHTPGGNGGVKLAVSCRTGLFARWVGPGLRLPG